MPSRVPDKFIGEKVPPSAGSASVFVMTLWTEGVAARSPYAWAQDKLRDEAICPRVVISNPVLSYNEGACERSRISRYGRNDEKKNIRNGIMRIFVRIYIIDNLLFRC